VSAARGRHVAHCVQEVHGGLLARSQGLPLGGPESVARVPVALREAAWVEAADCFTALLPGQEVSFLRCSDLQCLEYRVLALEAVGV